MIRVSFLLTLLLVGCSYNSRLQAEKACENWVAKAPPQKLKKEVQKEPPARPKPLWTRPPKPRMQTPNTRENRNIYLEQMKAWESIEPPEQIRRAMLDQELAHIQILMNPDTVQKNIDYPLRSCLFEEETRQFIGLARTKRSKNYVIRLDEVLPDFKVVKNFRY